MARIPQQELERLKEDVSVQRLVEDSGVVLRKAGKDLMGLCPYHADKSASLVVSPKKNLWNCFGCGIGGGAIDWVMKHRGLSFRQAVEVLQAEVGSKMAAQPAAASPSSLAAAAAVVVDTAQDAADQTLLAQTIDYYHQRLKDTAGQAGSAVAYLASRGLTHPGLVDAFGLGVADRTLGPLVAQGWPKSPDERSRKNINATRASLQRLGLLRQTGHEHFNGSLVIPLFDEAGVSGEERGAMGQSVVEVYGRKLRDDLKQDNTQYGSKHLYLR
ncbi:MAG: CHC2 zinc finger domain-containing protein, partial [Burkholderiaceae bacterium]